jgi:hypothetical protein
MASPGTYNTPSHFFIYNGVTLKQVSDPPNAASLSSFYGFMMVLPTGGVLFNSRFGDVEVYTDSGAPKAGSAPTITSAPTTITRGGSYTLAGNQLSGLTQGAAYGDDYQSATNYPLVRIVNLATKHVAYARTAGHSYMGVKPGVASTTTFTVPAGIDTGPSDLYAVANGIQSAPFGVTVAAGGATAAR